MKALNRAIARTVSQIARHAGEGCHVPMIMALENHLGALLTMERKMLDGVQEVELPVPSNSCFAPQDSQYWTPERIAMFNRWDASDKAPQAPDVIDMTDPRNWKVGDVVVRKKCDGAGFVIGNEYRVRSNYNDFVHIEITSGGISVGYKHFSADSAAKYFTWLRHGEVQS